MSLNINFAAIALVFFATISLCLGLTQDHKENMVITADSSVYNYKTGSTIFTGHVQVTQGSTHLTASQLITKSDNQHHLQEATAYGIDDLAHYWTLTTPDEPELHAKAKIIKLYPLQSNVSLEHDVILSRGTDHFHGELILYNRNDQTIIVPEKQNSRAILTYNPDKK